MNLDDKSLFLGAMEDVQPLKRHNDVHWHPERKTRVPQRVDTLQLDNFLTTGYLDIVPLATALEFKREGLQSGVLEKLRRGKYGQQASLNLLRQPVEKCRQMLFAFVVQAQKEGLRNVLIVMAKGATITPTPILFAATWRAGWWNSGSSGVLRGVTAPRRQRRVLRGPA
jgi:DNA-nicking Smr family endonuclease